MLCTYLQVFIHICGFRLIRFVNVYTWIDIYMCHSEGLRRRNVVAISEYITFSQAFVL